MLRWTSACLIAWNSPALAAGEGLATPTPAWTMEAGQQAELRQIAEQAIALGMPDARGGTLYLGRLVLPGADGGEEDQDSDEY